MEQADNNVFSHGYSCANKPSMRNFLNPSPECLICHADNFPKKIYDHAILGSIPSEQLRTKGYYKVVKMNLTHYNRTFLDTTELRGKFICSLLQVEPLEI